jgi:hypothetical protein
VVVPEACSGTMNGTAFEVLFVERSVLVAD